MKFLFVCTGNICRSPSAEALLRHKLKEQNHTDHFIDSAAIMGYHIGAAPDSRAIKTGREYGFDMSDLQARKVKTTDFDRFDIIYAMDKGHYDSLHRLANNEQKSKIKLFNEDLMGHDGDVEDPYYGSQINFDHMFKELDKALEILIKKHM